MGPIEDHIRLARRQQESPVLVDEPGGHTVGRGFEVVVTGEPKPDRG
jgi:hypothetical protein